MTPDTPDRLLLPLKIGKRVKNLGNQVIVTFGGPSSVPGLPGSGFLPRASGEWFPENSFSDRITPATPASHQRHTSVTPAPHRPSIGVAPASPHHRELILRGSTARSSKLDRANDRANDRATQPLDRCQSRSTRTQRHTSATPAPHQRHHTSATPA